MSVKRRLNSIRLDKIAGVDLPCQEHATVAIVKRAPTAGTPLAIAKKTFDEALRAQLVSERISDVFWRAFDNQYAVREAFRESLADELAEGGDGTMATDGFTAAMRTIAETAATLAREAGADAKDTDLESAVEQAVEKWLKQQETSEMKITTKAALASAVAAFAIAKSTVAEANDIIDAAVSLDDISALDANPDLAKMAEDGGKKKKKGDDAMKALQTEVAVLKMAPAVRDHYTALAADKQDAFLAKSAEDQAAEVEAANATDPVVYKAADGTEIRKSDGAVAAMMAKRMDEQAAEIAKLRTAGTESAIEKRARETYPNVASATAIAMLKSAAQVGETTDAGKDVLKSLDVMNKGRTTLFKSLGSTEAPEVGGSIEKARTDFNAEVSKIMGRDSVGMGDAMSKARVEHPDLFAEAYPDNAEQDA